MESVAEERTTKVVQKNSSVGRAVDRGSIGNRFKSCFSSHATSGFISPRLFFEKNGIED